MTNDVSKLRDALKQFVENTKNQQLEKDRAPIIQSISAEVIKVFAPLMQEMAHNSMMSKDDIKAVAEEIAAKINIPEINIPEIIMPAMPDINVPEPKVTVNVPEIRIPTINMPKEMDIKGWVQLQGVDLQNPLPVQLRDKDGKPVNLLENLTSLVSSSGGGGARIVKISDIAMSAWASLMNADGRLRVETNDSGGTTTEVRQVSGAVDSVVVNDVLVTVGFNQLSGATWSVSVNDVFRTTAASSLINSDDRLRVSLETGGGSLTDAELRAVAVPVSQLSGAIWSVAAYLDSTAATTLYNADNRLRVSVETGGGGLTDAELRAAHLDVVQMSGSVYSVNVLQYGGTEVAVGTELGAGVLRAYLVADAAYSVRAIANSGVDIGDVDVTSIAAGDNNIGNVDVLTIAAGDNNIGNVDIASSATLEVIQVSGSNWSVAVTGSITSSVVVGPIVADAPDDGNAPVQIGGVARTANPTAVAANDIVKSTHDDLGRQIIRNLQVRDLISTAYVSLTTGTETTLLAAVAGAYLDLVYLMATNNSDVAVSVDIRAVTAGNVQTTIRVPANGTAGVALPVPIPQDETGNNWTADLPDITGTTVTLSALFSREV